MNTDTNKMQRHSSTNTDTDTKTKCTDTDTVVQTQTKCMNTDTDTNKMHRYITDTKKQCTHSQTHYRHGQNTYYPRCVVFDLYRGI